ncbi:Crp/Fnr family transcriptional regulator [Bacillus sp. ISL-40]|jgi:CRP/FNR family transcriptional regulator, cyclic AMP receptor protein|uniref:Crp/Fnr family transcriptional regulator n=1 Tax=Priestia megaterium TaxID=1404 RepID=A0A6H1P7V5_PRIMG|nr:MULTISPECIES: Crp/Fnr family transcriptional regulator [Bacillaceae]MBT2701510.1 Crp/Fnr family transcriptional regulator [Bacillus sp. ISL-40]MBT2724390.1 Crp/Fnr family transcriptional regulator [Bacillus sp. ISL-46]MBT2739566.1 Crp/Fnr family transcriptional regulator [Bacillus sp. ISL-77]QIZ09680.1 Crp/Fnr family transcriptional regulator [Priestia megaterium]
MKIEEIKRVLADFTLFRELNDFEITKISDIAIAREWKKHSHVFLQGDPLENVYFIYDGKIKIYKSDINGKEQIVAIAKKGEMFPHVGFFRKGDYPAYAEVLESSTLIAVPISKFETVLIENPELCIKVFKVLGEKIVDLQNRLEEQILNNTYEQIIKLLIRLAQKHGKEQEDGTILLKSEFTNKDLANMIGTTRETISRTLTKMKKDELIEVDEEGNMIVDVEILMEEINLI